MINDTFLLSSFDSVDSRGVWWRWRCRSLAKINHNPHLMQGWRSVPPWRYYEVVRKWHIIWTWQWLFFFEEYITVNAFSPLPWVLPTPLLAWVSSITPLGRHAGLPFRTKLPTEESSSGSMKRGLLGSDINSSFAVPVTFTLNIIKECK